MKASCAVFGMILCAGVMSACVADEPAASDDDPVDVGASGVEVATSAAALAAAAPAEAAQIITVPPELSSARLDGTSRARNTSSRITCQITILSCADSRFSPCVPSFLQGEGCTLEQAACEAYWACIAACGPGRCDRLALFPGGGSC
jgi:hypothetical protein